MPDYQTEKRMALKLKAIPLPDLKGKSVLDVGCDERFWCDLAKERGASVVGIDRGRTTKDGRTIQMADHVMNLGKQWHCLGQFDVAFMFSLYHHVFQNARDHRPIWYWLWLHTRGQLLWENPLTAEDAVVQKNVDLELHPAYTEAQILSEARKWFHVEHIGPALHEKTREVYRFTPKPVETMEAEAVVISGAGGASKAFAYADSRRAKEIRDILGFEPFPGSLNLECDFDWNTGYFRAQILDVVDRANGLDSEWGLRWCRFYPVTVDGFPAYAMRFEGEKYRDNFVELISALKLRPRIDGAVKLERILPERLTVACVNVGNYCGQGETYVRTLRDMVGRNLETPHRFVCFTDSPIDGIECRPVPDGLTGWWAKLWLFHELKGPTLYLDLDTVITGPLEPLDYQGEFACLRDFYRPDGLGSGVMMWNGDLSRIWRDWDESGRPILQGGDQEWIEQAYPHAERLQDVFPGLICSFKVDATEGIPKDASVVCFHGKPRPHEVAGWVSDVWKVGGFAQPRFTQQLNTSARQILDNIRRNLRRDTEMLIGHAPHAGAALIVGGGPSLKESLPNLRLRRDRGGTVIALNATHDWLIDRGIVPDMHVLLDARPENIQFIRRPHKDVTYLVSSQCDPSVFDALEGFQVVQWVPWFDGVTPLCRQTQKPVVVVGGGNTVGLKAMCIAHILGYRRQHLYGFDSSYRGEENHAYRQPLNDGEATIEIMAAGRKFLCARWMARQAQDFQNQLPKLIAEGADIHVHGDGLIPWLAQHLMKEAA
jgi:CTP-dependent riboflavin kinase/uncharacterized Rossmann fold enzyme